MKTTRFSRLLASACILGLLAGPTAIAASNDSGWGEARNAKYGQMREERMAKALNLSDQQRDQIAAIKSESRQVSQPYRDELKSHRKAMRDLVRADTLDTAAVRALATQASDARIELAVIRAEQRHKIRAILTPAQQAQFDQMRPKRKKRRERVTN